MNIQDLIRLEQTKGEKMAFPYMVSYDIAKIHEPEYAPLTAYLKQDLKGEKILYSQWVVFHDGPAHKLAEKLTKFIKEDDRLLVQRMTSDIAAVNHTMNQNRLQLAIDTLRAQGR